MTATLIENLQRKLSTRRQGQRRRSFADITHLDAPLLAGLLITVSIGSLMLYSAVSQDITMIDKQILRLALAFSVMIMFAQIHPRHYRRWTPALYAVSVTLLIIVALSGVIGKGAQRWLSLGFIRFQPAEILKLSVPMTLAWYFDEHPLPPSLRSVAIACAILFVPVLLVAKEPDLGTAILVASSGASILWLAGVNWRLIFGTLTLMLASLPILWHFMHGYQRMRVLTFLNPERDPLGSGYHIIQSKIAIGSGGLVGKGWLLGTQSHLHFLPEHATDFIFAVLGEEFGFIGVLGLLAVYFFVILRCLYISMQAQTTYTRLLAGALSLTFFIAIFINMGMVTGILPVVGLPLPLISYGGTSMVTLMASFGILMSIHTHRQLITT